MAALPTHRERQFMQRLRGRSWVKAFELPEAEIIEALARKAVDRKSGRWEGLVVEDHGSGIVCEESADPAAPEMTLGPCLDQIIDG
jgi:hypothetical protein